MIRIVSNGIVAH